MDYANSSLFLQLGLPLPIPLAFESMPTPRLYLHSIVREISTLRQVRESPAGRI
jgi:hypothetical protein